MKTYFFIVIASISLLSGCAYIGGRANHQTVSSAEGENVDIPHARRVNPFTKTPAQRATENAAKMITPVE